LKWLLQRNFSEGAKGMASDVLSNASSDIPDHVSPEHFLDFDLYQLSDNDDVGQVWKGLEVKGRGSLLWSPRHGGHWIATDGEAVQEIVKDTVRFSSRVSIVPPLDTTIMPRFLPIMADPPEHGFYRSFINPFVTPKEIRAREASIRERAVELIAGLADRGSCEFMADFARRLPPKVFLTLAGLPLEDAEVLASTSIVRAGSVDAIEASMQRKFDYFIPLIRARRKEPRDDFIGDVVNRDVRGRQLTEEEALGVIMQFVGAGLDTVASVLGMMMRFLAAHPEHRRRLHAEPSLCSKAATEFLRRFPIATVARYVAEDMDFHGVSLKEGDIIVVPTGIVNFDEKYFSDPFTVNFDRPNSDTHFSFGAGTHRCPGAILAHAECKIVLEEWLRIIPEFQLDEDSVGLVGGIVTTLPSLRLKWGHNALSNA